MDPINQEGYPVLEEALNHEQDGLSLYARADLLLSPGYRFAPKDHELINFYLKKKINLCIRSANVYEYSPLDLTELYPRLEHDEWYFFTTPRNQMDLLWKRPHRVAGNGYWKACGTEKQIYHNSICIGSKKSLIFYEGNPPKGKKTNWVMKEYAIDNKDDDNKLLDDCVLCRIHRKKLHSSSRNKKQVASSKAKKQKTNKCVAIEHQGTSLQNNPPVLRSNRPMLRDGLVAAEITTVPAQDTNIVNTRNLATRKSIYVIGNFGSFFLHNIF